MRNQKCWRDKKLWAVKTRYAASRNAIIYYCIIDGLHGRGLGGYYWAPAVQGATVMTKQEAEKIALQCNSANNRFKTEISLYARERLR